MNGAAFVQAVQARRIDALARRAAGHEGAARQLLEQRLAQLRAAASSVADAAPGPLQARATAPLAGLLAHIAQSGAAAPATPADAPHASAPPELRAVRDHRGTWSRLSVEQRIRQALAQVPAQAGPLNTQRLVHEALSALRDVAPGYLHRLVAQVETLLWLENAGQGGPAFKGRGARPPSGRKLD